MSEQGARVRFSHGSIVNTPFNPRNPHQKSLHTAQARTHFTLTTCRWYLGLWRSHCLKAKLLYAGAQATVLRNPVRITPQLYCHRVPETTLPPGQLYRAFVSENVIPVGRVKVDQPCMIIHYLLNN